MTKRMTFGAIGLAALFACHGAVAQTHLDSDVPKYDFDVTYQNNIQIVLHEAFADDVILRMIGAPSFSSEYVVGLRKTAAGMSVFGLRTKMQIWAFQSRDQMRKEAAECDVAKHPDCVELKKYAEAMPNDIHDIGVERCSIPIPDALAGEIEDAWHLALLTAGKGKERLGIDGEYFYFAMNDAGQHLGGKIWSPESASWPRKLVSLAVDMNSLCEDKGTVTSSKVAAEASELVNQLRENR